METAAETSGGVGDEGGGARAKGRRGGAAFAVLPVVLLVVSALLLWAKGPFWLGCNMDPDYAYLFNGVAVAVGERPAHVDHPGTPVQVWAAVVTRVAHAVAGEGEYVADVLGRPERYMAVVLWTMIAGVAVVTGWVGASVARVTGSDAAGWVAQSGVFLAPTGLAAMLGVRPEPVVMGAALLLIAVAVRAMRGASIACAVGLGAICGVVVAAKLTALPLCVLPLVVLAGVRDRVVCVVGMLAGFAAGTVPVWGEMAYHFGFAGRILTHAERYGGGESGIQWSQNLRLLLGVLIREPAFVVAMLVGLAGVVVWWRSREGEKSATASPAVRLATGLAAVQLATIVMLFRHPFEARYAAAGLAVTGPALAVGLWLVMRGVQPAVAHRGMVAGAVVVVIGAGVSVYLAAAEMVRARDAELAVVDFLGKAPPAKVVVPGYGAPGQRYAVYFGSSWTRHRFAEPLARIYGREPIWDTWRNRLTDVTGADANWPAARRPIYLVGGPFLQKLVRLPKGFGVSIAAKHPPVTVYEVRPPEQPAP